jgi:hypothetical protein
MERDIEPELRAGEEEGVPGVHRVNYR